MLSFLSVAATDVNIVKAGLLIGRGQSLFIVLSGATGRLLVGRVSVVTVQYNCWLYNNRIRSVARNPLLWSLLSTIKYNAIQCTEQRNIFSY